MKNLLLATSIALGALPVYAQNQQDMMPPFEIRQKQERAQRYAVKLARGDGICSKYYNAHLLEGLEPPSLIKKNGNIESQLCNINYRLKDLDSIVNSHIAKTGARTITLDIPPLRDGTGRVTSLYTVDMYQWLDSSGGRMLFWDSDGEKLLTMDKKPKEFDGDTIVLFRRRQEMTTRRGEKLFPMEFDSMSYAIGTIKSRELVKLFQDSKQHEEQEFVFPFVQVKLLYQPEYFYSPFTPNPQRFVPNFKESEEFVEPSRPQESWP